MLDCDALRADNIGTTHPLQDHLVALCLGRKNRLMGGFFISMDGKLQMKTIVYIDGYNFFYGCLKHSADKWLDLHKLFHEYILLPQEPRSRLVSI